jgi:hypothetical protein
MKKLWVILFILSLSLSLSAQTDDIGQGAFFNDQGQINLLVDASIAVRFIDSDYVMFMVYMLTDKATTAQINRDTVVVVYNDEVHKMPTLKDFRKAFRQENRDMRIYNQLGKDSLVMSQFYGYSFNNQFDFFPLRAEAQKSTDSTTITSSMIIQTKVYIKNPGFKKGDVLGIAVRDVTDPNLKGSCAVVLK